MNDSARWYFDFVSPFAYLQLRKVLGWTERLEITPVPIAFGAVLQHCGQLGPAEIPGKREFTYRFVQWNAEASGTPLRFPPAHPFNPLAALRLCIAAGTTWQSVEAIYRHIWRDGRAGTTAAELADVGRALGIADVETVTQTDAVKATLRENTDAAIADGVFGVPTLRVRSELFWGNDATPMIEEWLSDPRRFQSDKYRRIERIPTGIQRRR
jgi:2-hydroxychromene-2-carboxylate isomerase